MCKKQALNKKPTEKTLNPHVIKNKQTATIGVHDEFLNGSYVQEFWPNTLRNKFIETRTKKCQREKLGRPSPWHNWQNIRQKNREKVFLKGDIGRIMKLIFKCHSKV